MKLPPLMTGDQFSDALATVGITLDKAVVYLGQDRRRILDWLHDDRDIPDWVPLFLTALTMPGAVALVEAASQALIKQRCDALREEEDTRCR